MKTIFEKSTGFEGTGLGVDEIKLEGVIPESC